MASGWRVPATIAAVLLTMPAASAQDAYPTKPVRMIVPLAPGGAVDVFARQLGAVFESRTGQAVEANQATPANAEHRRGSPSASACRRPRRK